VEIVFIYIGSPECSFCVNPAFAPVLNASRTSVKRRALSDSVAFTSHGISVGWDVEDGFEHLQSFGGFDEVSLGRNWFNLGAERYLWNEVPGTPATPQLLVIERLIVSPLEKTATGGYAVLETRLLARYTGVHAISSWVDLDSPLPRDRTMSASVPQG